MATQASSSIHDRGRELLRNGLRADFEIETNDGTFKVHSAILIVASGYFEKLLFGDFLESKECKVTFDDLSSSIIGRVIRYCYSPHVPLWTAVAHKDFSSSTSQDWSDDYEQAKQDHSVGKANVTVKTNPGYKRCGILSNMLEVADRLAMDNLQAEIETKFAPIWVALCWTGSSPSGKLKDSIDVVPFIAPETEHIEQVIAIIQTVFRVPLSASCHLRDLIVLSLLEYFEKPGIRKAEHKWVRRLIATTPDLAADLLLAVPVRSTSKCSTCGAKTFVLSRPCDCALEMYDCAKEVCVGKLRDGAFCIKCGY